MNKSVISKEESSMLKQLVIRKSVSALEQSKEEETKTPKPSNMAHNHHHTGKVKHLINKRAKNEKKTTSSIIGAVSPKPRA